MKRGILPALMLSFSLFAAAQGPFHKGVGVVRSIDAAKTGVMLAHEPIASLGWPAMTMRFAVKDKALLQKMQPGKKIEFEMVQQGRDYVITSVK